MVSLRPSSYRRRRPRPPAGAVTGGPERQWSKRCDRSLAAGAVRCGIDIELIDHLPRVADCWEDPFYRDHFAPAEIAYCQLQETPALHFAARWCAKEALKKCDGAFLPTAMKDIEVVADGTGSPFLVHHAGNGTRRLPHAVSLSHTMHAAVAVVVSIDALRGGSTLRTTSPLPRRCPLPPPPCTAVASYRPCWAWSPSVWRSGRWCGRSGSCDDFAHRDRQLPDDRADSRLPAVVAGRGGHGRGDTRRRDRQRVGR